MLIDTSGLNTLSAYLTSERDQIEQKLAKYGDVNPASTPQLVKFLFSAKSEGGLGLPVKAKTPKGSPSTGKEALTAIADKHPAVGMLLEWRVITKMLNTYAEGGEKGQSEAWP